MSEPSLKKMSADENEALKETRADEMGVQQRGIAENNRYAIMRAHHSKIKSKAPYFARIRRDYASNDSANLKEKVKQPAAAFPKLMCLTYTTPSCRGYVFEKVTYNKDIPVTSKINDQIYKNRIEDQQEYGSSQRDYKRPQRDQESVGSFNKRDDKSATTERKGDNMNARDHNQWQKRENARAQWELAQRRTAAWVANLPLIVEFTPTV